MVEGTMFFAVAAILSLAGAYAVWPPDLFSAALQDMTPAMLLRAALSLALAVVALEFFGALAVIVLSDR
jgi:drug/metabolite transporter superfamily protein YnfA